MRVLWLIALLALEARGHDLKGRIDPPIGVTVFLHDTGSPFATSTVSDAGGRFRFRKLPAGTYTLSLTTPVGGELRQTVELSPGTVDEKGNMEIVLRIDGAHLESEGLRAPGATISATRLSTPERAMQQYGQAQRCAARRDTACAISHLERAVDIAPQFASAWNQLGTIAYQSHRYAEAETNFRQAADADPEAFEPLVNLGGVLLNLDEPDRALEYNRRAVSRRPHDALANSQLGLTWLQLNDLSKAEKYLKIAIQLDPAHFSHPQLALAEVELRRGNGPGALAAWRGFLAAHPDAPEASAVRRRIEMLSRELAESAPKLH